jgi:tRNA-dihydrouridine synthase B
MSIAIGSLTLDDPVILAPMSGVTDLPFRRLVKSFGAGLVVSEMIASEAMIRQTRQSMAMAAKSAEERPWPFNSRREPAARSPKARPNAGRGAAIIDTFPAARSKRGSTAMRAAPMRDSCTPRVSLGDG